VSAETNNGQHPYIGPPICLSGGVAFDFQRSGARSAPTVVQASRPALFQSPKPALAATPKPEPTMPNSADVYAARRVQAQSRPASKPASPGEPSFADLATLAYPKRK